MPLMAMPIAVMPDNAAKALRRSRLRFHSFSLTIAWWRIRDQRIQEMLRGVGYFVYRSIERILVRV